MKSTTKYFHGTEELKWTNVYPLEKFLAAGGEKSKHNFISYCQRLMGVNAAGQLVPVTRKIYFKSYPSLHKCGSKCRSAKGHDCECSCSGQFHGAGN